MFKKKYILILLLLITVIGTLSTVSAGEINSADIDNNILEDTQELLETSTQEDMKLETGEDVQEISAQNADPLKTDEVKEEILTADESKSVLKADTPTHVNIAVSAKTVTYGKLQYVAARVTDDNGNPVENVKIAFKIYKGSKLVDTQTQYSTGKEGHVYYCTQDLKAGAYTIKYDIIDKNVYQASAVSSKLTVKKIKFTIKVKRSVGGLEIFVKKNKKPANKVKLKVKIYTGKKYKTIYLTSGYNKKLSKYKGYCGFVTNDLKAGKHKVVITATNKNYQAKKTTSIKITKSIKKGGTILAIVNGGKLQVYTGF